MFKKLRSTIYSSNLKKKLNLKDYKSGGLIVKNKRSVQYWPKVRACAEYFLYIFDNLKKL